MTDIYRLNVFTHKYICNTLLNNTMRHVSTFTESHDKTMEVHCLTQENAVDLHRVAVFP
jgi:hypothetical protein